jgi:hypothetical protein
MIISLVTIINRIDEISSIDIEAAKACLARKFKNYEIIVVDNVATDASRNGMHDLLNKHQNIRAVLLEARCRINGALSIGIRQAIGDYAVTLSSSRFHELQVILDHGMAAVSRQEGAIKIMPKPGCRSGPSYFLTRKVVNTLSRETLDGIDASSLLNLMPVIKYESGEIAGMEQTRHGLNVKQNLSRAFRRVSSRAELCLVALAALIVIFYANAICLNNMELAYKVESAAILSFAFLLVTTLWYLRTRYSLIRKHETLNWEERHSLNFKNPGIIEKSSAHHEQVI